MKKREKQKDHLLLKVGAIFFALALLLSTGMFFLTWWEQRSATDESGGEVVEKIRYNGQEYVLRSDIETLLVMGLDAFENEDSNAYRNDKQADFLLLVVMDKTANTCKAIQLNRDTMAEMDVLGVAGDKVDTTTAQLALSYTYGNGREVSCRNTANAVSRLLGVDIRHFVSVSMNAVPVYNDLVGGVSLTVMDDFSSIDPTLKKDETVTLTGQQALTYVRARQGLDDSTNVQRMKRQRQYLKALMEATDRRVNEEKEFILSSINAMKSYWVSNCTAKHLADMASRYHMNDPEMFHTIEGISKVGEKYMEFTPDAQSLKEIVIDCFYEPVR